MILAIIITEFPDPAERARAMGAYVFVSVAGGSLGLLAGGLLTQALSWHWVFLVNIPIGIATYLAGRALIRSDEGLGLSHGVDWVGSALVTASLMSGIYAIVEVTNNGWGSSQVLGFGALAAALMAAFLFVQARIENPIMPLRILRLHGLISASLIRGFLVVGMYSTFFLITLYLEQVRGFSALQTGAAFLPWTLTVAILSRGVTARLVERFGALPVLTMGMAHSRRRAAAVHDDRPRHRVLPDDLLRVLRDRVRDRQRVHAAADAGDGRRPGCRRRARLGDHERLPADERRPRARGAEHPGRRPHAGPDRRRDGYDRRADQRLPPRVLRGGGGDRRRASSSP